MKLGFKRGQKGFTLVELMVVMAILAVLAAIVFPAVSGTSEVAGDAQVTQDASTVNTAVSDYFGDQTGAEVLTTTTVYILNASATARSASANTTTTTASQVVSNRWPELNLTDNASYGAEFPSDNRTTVFTVIISDGTTTITPKQLAQGWNTINLSALASGNYIPAVPKSSSDLSTSLSRSYHNFLWLVKKTTATGGAEGASRVVQVFKLVKVDRSEASGNLDTLTYEQIY